MRFYGRHWYTAHINTDTQTAKKSNSVHNSQPEEQIQQEKKLDVYKSVLMRDASLWRGYLVWLKCTAWPGNAA